MSDNIVIFRIYNNLQHNIRTKGKIIYIGIFCKEHIKLPINMKRDQIINYLDTTVQIIMMSCSNHLVW